MASETNQHRDLLPEEQAAGSDDPEAESAAILRESEERSEDRLDSGGTVEHRTSDSVDRP